MLVFFIGDTYWINMQLANYKLSVYIYTFISYSQRALLEPKRVVV
ncbi:hypothetical protein VCRA2128O305_10440 [Vibrio crassostreae]|uniref:Uncharacterized protein n=1 Tax=Vibrio crassostreae TaxID=246167 RepID=A0A822N0I3_9VIBR|nr:hypothetical protein VCRA2110O175_160015 [Vibrio crassostreae]CAK1839159.1 hypothetical protein VCRA2113O206_10181 [Vibrio crassostreae]CAK1839599.1 hypothetical protein VCRA2110O178_10011 [Vibrio crassostreae]CAK1843377.1 hypothetical protein VCRA2112E186_10208 [Vibrio crassostreae]CAK1845440.1 hypothetical protein VCRA2116O234_10208 [Vibrio crassostreae]